MSNSLRQDSLTVPHAAAMRLQQECMLQAGAGGAAGGGVAYSPGMMRKTSSFCSHADFYQQALMVSGSRYNCCAILLNTNITPSIFLLFSCIYFKYSFPILCVLLYAFRHFKSVQCSISKRINESYFGV